MKLLDRKFKLVGLALLIPSAVACALMLFADVFLVWDIPMFALFTDTFGAKSSFCTIIKDSVYEEVCLIAFMVSLLFMAFSKEKVEDEYINHLRAKSFLWSTLVASVVFIIGTMFIHGFCYLNFVFIYPFLSLILYLVKFNWSVYRLNTSQDEK